MAENERTNNIDDSQRLTYKDLLGSEKAKGRIESDIGKVEDPNRLQEDLHNLKTKSIEDKPYDWQSEDTEANDKDSAINNKSNFNEAA